MAKPLVMIVKEHGTNCENESKFAFERAGANADVVHMNDWISSPKKIRDYQIVMFPGGFSYGDDTGSAYAWSNRLKNNVWGEMRAFVEKGLVLGVCNGFQLLVNSGLLPALDRKCDSPQSALVHNVSPRYTCRWVDLHFSEKSPWLSRLESISLPVAHGEGKFYASEETLARMNEKGLIAARYVKGAICEHEGLPANPNGSLDDIASITDASGKILGMMPHPERAIHFTQLPHWTYLKSMMRRSGENVPEEGPGLQVFRNGVNYFTEE